MPYPISKVRKSDYDYHSSPHLARDGTFRVVVECQKCKKDTYAIARWEGDRLHVLRAAPGPSEYSSIPDECQCSPSAEDMKFMEFEWREEFAADARTMLLLKYVMVAGFGAHLLVLLDYTGPMSRLEYLGANLTATAVFAGMVWVGRKLDEETRTVLSEKIGRAAYAIAVWGLPLAIFLKQ